MASTSCIWLGYFIANAKSLVNGHLASSLKTHAKVVLLLPVIAATIATVVVLTNPFVYSPSCPNPSNTSAYFTIQSSSQGFNGSKNYNTYWPIMNVHCGQTVTIRVTNTDTAEPHGFTIEHYDIPGQTVRPGFSVNVTFVAALPGRFRVFCNIPCVPHFFMQNGTLVVSS